MGWISLFRIINVTTYLANIPFHNATSSFELADLNIIFLVIFVNILYLHVEQFFDEQLEQELFEELSPEELSPPFLRA